jgi:hypothetical protein
MRFYKIEVLVCPSTDLSTPNPKGICFFLSPLEVLCDHTQDIPEHMCCVPGEDLRSCLEYLVENRHSLPSGVKRCIVDKFDVESLFFSFVEERLAELS